jgi:hypothetical protein
MVWGATLGNENKLSEKVDITIISNFASKDVRRNF